MGQFQITHYERSLPALHQIEGFAEYAAQHNMKIDLDRSYAATDLPSANEEQPRPIRDVYSHSFEGEQPKANIATRKKRPPKS
jgi:hypothetical protein